MSVGRNQQCPCGSGKKYKKCCGVVTPITQIRSVREQNLRKESAQWIERLTKFVTSQISQEVIIKAREQFATHTGLPLQEATHPQWADHFINWFVLDVEQNGTSLIKQFVSINGKKMEREVKEAFLNLRMGLYELISHEDEVLRVTDLATNETHYILASPKARVESGQIIMGRLFGLGNRNMLFSGSVVLQPFMKDQMIRVAQEHPINETADISRRTLALYEHVIQDGVRYQQPQQKREEGMIRYNFAMESTDQVRELLEKLPSFELKKRDAFMDVWVFAKHTEQHLFTEFDNSLLELHEVAGEILLQEKLVMVEGYEQQVSEIADQLQLIGPIKQQIEHLTSTRSKLSQGTLFITSQPALPPRVLQWAVQTYFAEKWLLTAHPELSGLAPVLVAASDKAEAREELAQLIAKIDAETALGQGLARFMRTDLIKPRLALDNDQVHIGNLLKRPLIEGLPESLYTVLPERLDDIASFVEEMTSGKSESTVKKYDETMNLFRSFVRSAFGPSFTWEAIRPQELAYFLSHDVLQRVDAPSKTLATNLLSVLTAFFKWLDKRHGLTMMANLQGFLAGIKEELPEAYRIRGVLVKEASANLKNEAIAPEEVSGETLIVLEKQADGYQVVGNGDELFTLKLEEKADLNLQPGWLISGVSGKAKDGQWRLYGTPELYPPTVAELLGVEVNVPV
ncbi:YecA family protein [Brevibacillus dissolubilis]|uniref:YecA family protein n=1 Tax=Brevibacillus dissolubilis TaxID=1844116 RepID=UPI0011173520|nr:SEC-C metal-binding domain-containing protein [Brevibacillus dissolubilis]